MDTITIENASDYRSAGIGQWAAEAGGAEKKWRNGDNYGWIGANGTRAIETNGDPVWEDDVGFAEAWADGSGEVVRPCDRAACFSSPVCTCGGYDSAHRQGCPRYGRDIPDPRRGNGDAEPGRVS